MARTRIEWEAIFDDYAEANGLSSSSAAEYKEIRDLIVTEAMASEMIHEQIRGDIDEQMATKQPGSITWYPDMIRAFQYEHSLVVTEGILGYAEDDEEARIVTHVSVKEQDNGNLIVKVAKTVADELAPLDNDELTALAAYIKARRFPGVGVDLFSRTADEVKYIMTCQYDPAYAVGDLEDAVEAALEDFRTNFRFDAVFYKSQLMAAIQNIAGIVSVRVQIDMSLSDSTSVANMEAQQELPAGYFNWDVTSSLTFIAI